MILHEDALCRLLEDNALLMAAFRAVRSLGLPQGALGAGIIRAAVWDHLAGSGPTPVDDADVIYFDPEDPTTAAEARHESRLRQDVPDLGWSVRNQARMHLRNGDRPYASVEDAMRHWLETPTCVALALGRDDRLRVIAPFGLDDLFAMRIRPTPRGRERRDAYQARLQAKGWRKTWPSAQVFDA